MKNAQDFKDVACAVVASPLVCFDRPRIGQGDVAADLAAARNIRAAARAIYNEIAEEMDALDKGK